jgi:hypothetical protein
VESADGAIELRRLPKPRPEEITKRVERIARRTLAMLREEMSEEPRCSFRANPATPALPQPERKRASNRLRQYYLTDFRRRITIGSLAIEELATFLGIARAAAS